MSTAPRRPAPPSWSRPASAPAKTHLRVLDGESATTHPCAPCPRLSDSVWKDLDDAHHATLDAARQLQSFEPGQRIVAQGEACAGIHCVQRGEFAVRRVDDAGRSIVLGLGGPGEAVGSRAFFAKGTHAASVEALQHVTTCFIPATAMRELVASSPRLAVSVLERITKEADEADDTRLRQVFLPVRARFAHLLLDLRDRHGRVDDDGSLVITLPLSRQDIAAALGTTPETVARTVGALQSDGVATFTGRTVRVPDLDLLMDELEAVGVN